MGRTTAGAVEKSQSVWEVAKGTFFAEVRLYSRYIVAR